MLSQNQTRIGDNALVHSSLTNMDNESDITRDNVGETSSVLSTSSRTFINTPSLDSNSFVSLTSHTTPISTNTTPEAWREELVSVIPQESKATASQGIEFPLPLQNLHHSITPRYLRIHPSHIAISRQVAQLTNAPLLPSSQIPTLIPLSDHTRPTLKYMLAENMDAEHVAPGNQPSSNGVFTKYMIETESSLRNEDELTELNTKEVSLESLRNTTFLIFGMHFSKQYLHWGIILFLLEILLLVALSVFELMEDPSVGRTIQVSIVNIITFVINFIGVLGLWRKNISLLTIAFGFHILFLCLQLIQIETLWQIFYIILKAIICVFLWVCREQLMASWFTTSTLTV